MSESEETIEITGRAVRLYRTPPSAGGPIDRQVRLVDFLKEVAASSPQRSLHQLPLLPPGSRWVIVRGRALVIAVEQPPQVRRVNWSG